MLFFPKKPSALAMVAVLLMIGPLRADKPPETVDLRVDDQPLIILLERIARQCGKGLLVHGGLEDKLQEEVRLYAKDAPWDETVKLLREEYGLEVEYTEKRLEVRSVDELFRATLVRRHYPTEVITRGLADYPGYYLGISPPPRRGWGGSVVVFDEASASAVSDALPELVLEILGTPRSDLQRGVRVDETHGILVVRHSPDSQSRIEAILKSLERTAARQVCCRLYELRRPPERGTLDIDQKRKLVEGLQPISVFVASDGQRNHHLSGNRRPYVSHGVSVEEAVDPVVDYIQEGIVLEVQPNVTRAGIVSNVRLQLCEHLSSREGSIDDDTGAQITEVEHPRVRLDQVHDSRLVPNGGAVVLRCGKRVFLLSFEVQ